MSRIQYRDKLTLDCGMDKCFIQKLHVYSNLYNSLFSNCLIYCFQTYLNVRFRLPQRYSCYYSVTVNSNIKDERDRNKSDVFVVLLPFVLN